jgi:DNA topoisomerase-1
MVAAIGRFGPYIRHNNQFYSLGKEDDPLTVTEDRAREIIETKRKSDSEKVIKVFDENQDVKILNGRWGPYIAVGKQNVKIPKGKEPKDLTLAECLELSAAAPEKKGRFGRATTAAAKAATATKEAPKKSPKKAAAATKAKKTTKTTSAKASKTTKKK